MSEAKFVLSRKIVKKQVQKLLDLGLCVSYSYKTNKDVGNILQDICSNVDFSIHSREEIEMIRNKSKIWFFTQAESKDELKEILDKDIRSFVVDNEIDLQRLLEVIKIKDVKINLGLRMKFKEHRIGSGKYFVYGMSSKKINEIIEKLKDKKIIKSLGVHINRKSQNTSEWEIKQEIEDSLKKDNLNAIDFLNLGGGLPVKYISYSLKTLPYIFEKLKIAKEFLDKYNIKVIVEPGRFIAAPSVKLEVEIIQIQEKNLIINTTLYNCALDTLIGEHKLFVEGELGRDGDGDYYLIKGNSPTRDDIFRYKVKLKNINVGDKLIFLNAGAYNYTTDFFGYKKLKTEVID